MRDEKEINHARHVVARLLKLHPTGSPQYATAAGMSVALQWASGENDNTLQHLITAYDIAKAQPNN